jgi:hypothetical protein
MSVEGGFSQWFPLTSAGVEENAPDAPAAVQLARADKSLVPYPRGKSAMVFYFYAARSAKEALKRLFAEELESAGARGQGPLTFRVLAGGDEARRHLERLYFEFEERFGSAPVLHAEAED